MGEAGGLLLLRHVVAWLVSQLLRLVHVVCLVSEAERAADATGQRRRLGVECAAPWTAHRHTARRGRNGCLPATCAGGKQRGTRRACRKGVCQRLVPDLRDGVLLERWRLWPCQLPLRPHRSGSELHLLAPPYSPLAVSGSPTRAWMARGAAPATITRPSHVVVSVVISINTLLWCPRQWPVSARIIASPAVALLAAWMTIPGQIEPVR